MVDKWKKAFLVRSISDDDYNFVLDRICENNRKILIILCTVFSVIFAILLTLGFFGVGIDVADMPIFMFAFVSALSVIFLVMRSSKKNYALTMIATYMVIVAAMTYGIVVSYRSPEQYTVTFIALVCIIAMTFVDKPIKLGITYAVGTVACVCMICVRKVDYVQAADIINVISFSVLSMIGGIFTMNMKIHGYVMDKLQEQDIEKGLRRLNAKEMEASQLLTAVKASYAMVVSVNLTKNTYKLIGEESFVTQGDDIVGSFDEVIDIHASKVVEEQRQLYRDTFSREGLLKAYAEGKKEVYLEYQQCDDDGVPHWLGTHTMFTVTPNSEDVTEITISQNIDDRVRKEEESKAILAAERDRAEQAQKAKTDFLFQMSHDIRTPMNAIIGYTNFIKSTGDSEIIHNDYVPKLDIAGQQLLMLINDALEMSRIESGKLTFRRKPMDIRSLIMNVMAVMQIQAEEKGLTLTSDIVVDNPIVYCDQNHLSRVVMNLLSNAVKFTPAGGSVKVSLWEQPSTSDENVVYELKVVDNGIGMSPEFVSRIFEPFEREQTSTVSGMQGTGLGLAIVKRIVDAAGDTITVETKQGEGTTFTLNIILPRANQEELQSLQNRDETTLPIEQMASCFKGKRILLVEDNEFNLAIAQTLLENAGFSVETATDGRMAINKVLAAPVDDYYDAILMDVQMPVMNGYEATREIRKLPDGRAKTIIIAVTANAFDTDKDDAIAAGMNGHIAKPIDVAVLYKTLWNQL